MNALTDITQVNSSNNNGLAGILLGSLLGKDAQGNVNKLDLNNYVTLPDVNVGISQKQLLIGLGIAALLFFPKFKKWLSI